MLNAQCLIQSCNLKPFPWMARYPSRTTSAAICLREADPAKAGNAVGGLCNSLLDSVVTRCEMMWHHAERKEVEHETIDIVDTIYPTERGHCWNRICPGARAFGVASRRIIVCLSMPCSGFYAPAPRGGICHRTWGTGRTCNGGFVAGGTKGWGRNCSKP